MPHVSTIISGAASLGVLAGVVSGIFYLVLTGIRWAGRLRAALQEEEARRQNGIPPGSCVICGRPPDAVTPGPGPVGCSDCGGRTCKGDGCSRRSSAGWRCVLCHVKRDLKNTSGNWFNQKTTTEQIEPSAEERNIDKETVQVREFIEKLVEALVGGPLDGVTVGKLSTHSAYLGMFAKYHGSLCQGLARLGFALQLSIANNHGSDCDSPSSAHAALKQLIEKIVSEAMALPNLKEALRPSSNGTNSVTNDEEDFSNKSYEDILATAILNKVIERFQQQNGRRYETIDRNSNLVTGSNSVGSASIHDEDLHSNSDWSDTSRTEPLSLTIEEHIEEVTTAYESSDDDERRDITQVDTELKVNRRVPFPELGMDIVDGNDASEVDENSDSEELQSSATELVTPTNSWEENWLFQRKKLRTTPSAHHPVPVPMLVPNPSQEFRALIGGVDADDLSDMSECSDSVLEDLVMAEDEDDPNFTKQIVDALNNETESSQNDSKNDSEQIEISNNVESELEQAKEEVSVKEGSHTEDEIETKDNRNEEINGFSCLDEYESGLGTPPDSLNSPHSLSQKDREFSVDYESVHQIDISASKTPVPRPRNLDLINSEKSVEETPPKCTIAEREKEKWKHAIELPDNPYSPENIAKRDQQRRKDYFRSGCSSEVSVDFPEDLQTDDSDSSRYGRDYYVKTSTAGNRTFRSIPSNQFSDTSAEENTEEEGKIEVLESAFAEKLSVEEDNKPQVTRTEQKVLPVTVDNVPEAMIRKGKEVRVLVRCHAVDKPDVGLPSVRELAKQFMQEEKKVPDGRRTPQKWKTSAKTSQEFSSGDSASNRVVNAAVNMEKVDTFTSTDIDKRDSREDEVDYSLVPVSQIISNLTRDNIAGTPRPQERLSPNKNQCKNQKVSNVQRENGNVSPSQLRGLKVQSCSKIFDDEKEEIFKSAQTESPIPRFNGKQVHSLTARSISKEFREGLKKNSYHRLAKIDRGSPGESDHGEIYSAADSQRPPTPPIDLKSKKKFWEDIIYNSSKQN